MYCNCFKYSLFLWVSLLNQYFLSSLRNSLFVLVDIKDYFYRIEWEAYDDHSGLDTVYWKLYDSYGTFVEHGHEDLPAQGKTDVT